jgi:hypothetical protein
MEKTDRFSSQILTIPKMSFHDEVVSKLTDPTKQKPYKESSVKPVWVYLRALNGGISPTSLDYLLDKEVVMPYLEKYAVSTQRSIIFVIRNVAKDFKRQDILDAWRDSINNAETGMGLLQRGEKSEKQAEAYARIEEGEKGKAWDKLQEKNDARNEAKGVSETKNLVPNLYMKFPPRRNIDYTEMKITTDYKGEVEHNYLVIGEEGDEVAMRFVFNRYKTSGNYHQQVFDVPDDLVALLKQYIEANGKKEGDFLLGKLRNDDITDMLNKAFGRGISTQMLRHMYLDKYNSPEKRKIIEEMMGDAEQMSHSISIQQGVYVKK